MYLLSIVNLFNAISCVEFPQNVEDIHYLGKPLILKIMHCNV